MVQNNYKNKNKTNENDENKNYSNGSTQALENKPCTPKYVPPLSQSGRASLCHNLP